MLPLAIPRKSFTGFTAHHDLNGQSPGSALRHTDVTGLYACLMFLLGSCSHTYGFNF